MVPVNLLDTWKTASFYHFIHTAVIFIIVLKQQAVNSKNHLMVINGFLLGMILFSGNLYLYVITQIKLLAMITPIGGLVLLASWPYWFMVELTTR